jgi:hypothetical protein
MISQDSSFTGMEQGEDGASAPRAGVIDAAKDRIQQLASQARDTASEQAESRFTSGKARATDTLGSIAQTLHSTSKELRDKQQGKIGDYAEQAAGKAEELAQYLQNATLSDIATRVEDFARREPALFVGSALALGFFGARFLKSSQRNQQGSMTNGQQRPSGASQFGARQGGMRTDAWTNTGEREMTRTTEYDYPAASTTSERNTDDRLGLA